MPRLDHLAVARVLALAFTLVLLSGAAYAGVPATSFSASNADIKPNFAVWRSAALPAPANVYGGPAIEGWVTAKATNRPVPGAAVSVEIEGVNAPPAQALTDWQGHFTLSTHELQALQIPRGVTVTVRTGKYADWVMRGAVYYPGDTLRVYARLGTATGGQSVLTAAQGAVHGPAQTTGPIYSLAVDLRSAPHIAGTTGQAPAQVFSPTPPATIRVYRTATGTVEVVPFRDYLKHVLPNEWIPTWSPEALKAGAMAVKTYAWYWIARGGKRAELGADLKDNADDQVYDPNVSYASTDAAVDATFNYTLTRNGALIQAQYCAGNYDPDPEGECPWSGTGTYMTQWGTAYYADRGKGWGWITEFYYTGAKVSPAPPGGGYDGSPPPPAATPVPAGFTVGHGAANPDVFREAYERNGGAQMLGSPTDVVRWWLPYVSENNVLAQPFSGRAGEGGVWIVYDVLKSAPRAYVLSGQIAQAYAGHTPPGPEWVGAPTSDPYISGPEAGGVPGQGFTKGTLSVHGGEVVFNSWPDSFTGWNARYFVGYQPPSPQTAPAYDLPGQPALVRDVPDIAISWSAEARIPASLGLGSGGWSAQFTRQIQPGAGTYDFTLTANSGARLWVDGVLAINGWFWEGTQTASYSADFDGGVHTIRVQYYSKGGDARLEYTMLARTPMGAPPTPQSGAGRSSGSLHVQVRWLGRPAPPHDSWAQPIVLYLSRPGDAVRVAKFDARTDRNGIARFDGLPTGVYNVHVKGPHSLQTARASVNIMPGQTVNLDMKAQIEGDVDGDNCVTVNDFALVQAMLGTDPSTPGYNPQADLNGDGEVSMSDISLLRSGFDMCGDISADNQFRAMSTGGAPTLSQVLSPWLNPDRLQRPLSLHLNPSTTHIRVGEMVAVDVVAQAGTQPIDGVSFILKYDPGRLQLVDEQGAPAKGAEPGAQLPSVMGNWVDHRGGAVGYAAGILQGAPPDGWVLVAHLRFRALTTGPEPAQLSFYPTPSRFMQVTNGGVNLLGRATGAAIIISP